MRYIAEYQEYLNIGGVCDATAFNRNIDRACVIIDNATQKRIERMSTIPAQAKALCRDLVEYFAADIANSKRVTSYSQSIGSLSESESFQLQTSEERTQEINGMVHDYLLSVTDDTGTPLLYKGAMG